MKTIKIIFAFGFIMLATEAFTLAQNCGMSGMNHSNETVQVIVNFS